jgi:hypothetical protein
MLVSINQFNPSTLLYLSQARTRISNVICHDLFYVEWIEVRCDSSFCWYWWNCWPSLFKLSFHNWSELIWKFNNHQKNTIRLLDFEIQIIIRKINRFCLIWTWKLLTLLIWKMKYQAAKRKKDLSLFEYKNNWLSITKNPKKTKQPSKKRMECLIYKHKKIIKKINFKLNWKS